MKKLLPVLGVLLAFLGKGVVGAEQEKTKMVFVLDTKGRQEIGILFARDQEVEEMSGVNPLQFFSISNAKRFDKLWVEMIFGEAEFIEVVNRKMISIEVHLRGGREIHPNDSQLLANFSVVLHPYAVRGISHNTFFLESVSGFEQYSVRLSGYEPGGVFKIYCGPKEDLRSSIKVSELSPLWKWIPRVIDVE